MAVNLDRISDLEQRWQQCWQDVDLLQKNLDRQNQIEQIFKLLVTAYTRPDRHYHNLTHIHHFLTTLDSFATTLENPIAVSLAAWFHDFVYDPHALDNEFQSAKAAGELLLNLGGNPELICRVQELIMATQGHEVMGDDLDRSIFLDADLAILGADPERYQAYSEGIRREYSWVSDAGYQVGRIRVLENFLQRDRIYYTEQLFDRLESIARTNMLLEIEIRSTDPSG